MPNPPDPDDDEGPRYRGKFVVVLIVGWTAVLLFLATLAVHRLKADPCWDRGPGSPAPPPECHSR